MEKKQQALTEELGILDVNLGFLLLIVTSVLLSFWALSRQRGAAVLRAQGHARAAQQADGAAARGRLGANALTVGSLGFFFQQALERYGSLESDSPTAQQTARMDIIAGFLVLLATLIRLLELNLVRRDQPTLDGTLLPE